MKFEAQGKKRSEKDYAAVTSFVHYLLHRLMDARQCHVEAQVTVIQAVDLVCVLCAMRG